MSGRLVVLDRAGRAGKRFPLAAGLATLGRGAACDIRVLLPAVAAHHATITVHANQTVVRNVGGGLTLVNGAPVSVHALRHGDELALGGRRLRWEYDRAPRRQATPHAAPDLPLALPAPPARAARRGTLAAAPRAPDRDLQLALELRHRASMPASSTGGKQVAIVQPQRRDTNQNEAAGGPRLVLAPHRPAAPAHDAPKRRSLHTPTKATLWIESRRGRARAQSARHAPPLRLAVLRRAATPVAKIQAPREIDPTKQAAIMLMTGHTPKSKLATPKQASGRKSSASFVVSRRTPRTPHSPRTPRLNTTRTPAADRGSDSEDSFRRTSTRKSAGASQTASILEISDSEASSTRRSWGGAGSPGLPSPRKSALKDPRRGARKHESIKFDLSHLERGDESDALTVSDATRRTSRSDEGLTLRYSSSPPAPSPRRALSRSLASPRASSAPASPAPPASPVSPASPASPRARPGSRGSIVQRALDASAATRASGARGRRTTRTLEAYSIVDLVSGDSDASVLSEYNSAASSAISFGTPRSAARSELTLLGSSTPLPADSTLTRSPARASRSPAFSPAQTTRSPARSPALASRSPAPSPALGARSPARSPALAPRSPALSPRSPALSPRSPALAPRSPALVTPESAPRPRVSGERVSRAARSRSRLDETGLLASPVDVASSSSSRKSSRRTRSRGAAPATPATAGEDTPERHGSPEEAGTPVLSMTAVLDASVAEPGEPARKRGRPSAADKRKTFAASARQAARPARGSTRSKSLNFAAGGGEITPTGAAPPAREAVKSKHSSAKKSRSRRSIIDNLEDSTFVKDLFNSPVKRKLSQSMTEFSRRLDDDDEAAPASRNASAIPADVFVSPLSPESPDVDGVRRLFARNEPRNDLRDLRGVRRLLKTPRARRSIRNDLRDVAGVKVMFAKSPRNRLSDVRGVKEMFAAGPEDDLRRVSGVKSLFGNERGRRPRRDDLTDVRGVKDLFKRGPKNELENVSGVKETLRANSPKNDLRDVRGVRRLYKGSRGPESPNVSGVARLLDSPAPAEPPFDEPAGRPRVKATYSKSFTARSAEKREKRRPSLRAPSGSPDAAQWQQQARRSIARALLHLSAAPAPRGSRARRSASDNYSAHTLPIKKRSLQAVAARPAESARLPIKKRALVHSTPLKGARRAPTIELGRVSPIASLAAPVAPVAPVAPPPRSPIVVSESPKPKSTKTRKTKTEIAKEAVETVKPSPKKTRAKVVEEKTSRVRATRSRVDAPEAKKDAKKADEPAPKRAKKSAVVAEPPVAKKSTRKTAAARSGAEDAVEPGPAPKGRRGGRPAIASPGRPARGRARRASLALPKPSPGLKPRPPVKAEAGAKTEEAGAKTKKADAKKKEADAKKKEAGAKKKEADAKKKEAGAKTKRAGAKTEEAGAKTEEAGAKIKEAGAETEEAGFKTRAPAARANKKGRPVEKIDTPKMSPGRPKRSTRAAAAAAPEKRATPAPAGGRAAPPPPPPRRPPPASPPPRRARRPPAAEQKQVAEAAVVPSAPRGRKRKNEASSADKKEPSPKKPRGRARAIAAKAESPAAPRARRRR